MSFAGLSFETATRRVGGWDGEEAEAMRVRMEERFSLRVFARVGSIFISESLLAALWAGSVMLEESDGSSGDASLL